MTRLLRHRSINRVILSVTTLTTAFTLFRCAMPTDTLIGRTIGQYEIRELLGEGGMARVYRARQSSLNRDVAVKVVYTNITQDQTFAERFIQETELIAGLQHLHIVPVHDYKVTEDGIAYLTMRHLKGGNLAEKIRREGQLPLGDIARLLAQIAGALDYAHGQNVIHRDMKPSNILLDERGNAYLADFGLARIVEDDERVKKNLTATGVFLGTPSYISPEQVEVGRASMASDLYSLGIILYEMIAGRPPFIADSVFRLMQAHISEKPPKITSLRPNLPDELNELLTKALAKNPDERFESATALSDSFNRVIQSSVDTQPLPGTIPTTDSKIAFPVTPIPANEDSPTATALNIGAANTYSRADGKVDNKVTDLPSASKQPAAKRRITWKVAAVGAAVILGFLIIGAAVNEQRRSIVVPTVDNSLRPVSGDSSTVIPTEAEIAAARFVLSSKSSFVGAVACSLETDFHASLMRGARVRATELGLPFRLEDADNDKARQSAMVNKLVAEGASIIFACVLDEQSLESALRAASEAGVLVVTSSNASFGQNSAAFTLPPERMGEIVGGYAAEVINAEMSGKATVAILTYSPLPSTVARASAMVDTLMKNAPNVTIIGTYEGGLPQNGKSSIAVALKEHPGIDIILSINDAGAYGAIEALVEAGRATDSVRIFSVDAEPEARRLIERGEYFRASLALDPAGIGKLAIDAGVRWMAGVAIPMTVNVDGVLITRESLVQTNQQTVTPGS